MPFYWFYKLLDPTLNVVPKITYITSIIPAFLVIPASGYGYLMGFSAKKLINKDFTELKSKLFYKGDKNK